MAVYGEGNVLGEERLEHVQDTLVLLHDEPDQAPVAPMLPIAREQQFRAQPEAHPQKGIDLGHTFPLVMRLCEIDNTGRHGVDHVENDRGARVGGDDRGSEAAAQGRKR